MHRIIRVIGRISIVLLAAWPITPVGVGFPANGKQATSAILGYRVGAHSEATRDQPVVEWIRRGSVRLTTVQAGHGFDDMQPLKKMIGDSRIVALGESTHGTHEFFELKHRMIEFLANQMGFTIFSIEANMPEAYRLNDFIVNGNGDPKQLLKGMYFWTWDTEEVLDMIMWMRDFNRSGKGHIEFTGFDMQTPTAAVDIVRGFVKRYDAPYQEFVDRTYKAVEPEHRQSSVPSFGVATCPLPAKEAAGKHIRYSGFIQTENITQGFAGLWWRVDGEPGQVLAFDNMQGRGARGNSPWTRYEISLDVPTNAKAIYFGVLHPGNGTAWFDSLQVEINGVQYKDDTAFDLDFESDSPRGFYTGGAGYAVTIDKAVAHTGKQSLSIKSLDTHRVTDEMAADAKRASEACKHVLKHLEARRATLVRTASAKDVDWAIQNARLVLQFAQLKTGEKTRDESMAENIKWIADHSPGAKVVLWAHNGHIAYSTTGEGDPMGAYLRKTFGNALVSFGFSFNEGSFRAVEAGKGSLREFAVGPLPEGSLDRTLAAAGIPILALDLRQLPLHGFVHDWFNRPRASRSIGAVYSVSSPTTATVEMRVRDAFDVILFVDKTTAARGNL